MAHTLFNATIIPEIVKLIAKNRNIPEREALDMFYSSKTCECLNDDETGFYGQSALFIYGEFCKENGTTAGFE